MTITFSMTARELITKAMQDRKIIGLGVTPKDKEIAYGKQALNLMFKSWAARGLTLWTDEDGAATVAAGNPVVALDPRPIDVNEVNLAVSATYERPLTRWEKGDYATMPNKLQAGEPLIYTPVYTADGMSLKVWPVPTADRTLTYSYSRVIEDVDQLSDPVDVPQMWLEAVAKVLATKLTVFGGDPNHLAMIKGEADVLERQMFDHDRPASYHIGADRS